MKKLNRKTIGLLAASLILVVSVGVGSALAYFTTYTKAVGGEALTLNFTDTHVDEIIKDDAKHIVLTNKGSEDAYVRIKALVGDEFQSIFEYVGDEDWIVDADGYVYYDKILAPGEATTEIDVVIDFESTDKDFNVIIVQESTPVLYDEDGLAYADWLVSADVVNE